MSVTQTLQSGDGILIKDDVGNILMFTCAGDPTVTDAATNAPGDSVSGYSSSAICIRTDSPADTTSIYINTGSATSSTWAALRISAG